MHGCLSLASSTLPSLRKLTSIVWYAQLKPDSVGFPPAVVSGIALEAQVVAETTRREVDNVPLLGQELRNEVVAEANKQESDFESSVRDRGEL